MRRLSIISTVLVLLGAHGSLAQTPRQAMVERARRYLVNVQRDGALGDSRQKAVTGLFILAMLSDGITPTEPKYGPPLTAAWTWIQENSTEGVLGGREEPNADHAIAALALTELVGAWAPAASPPVLIALAQKSLAHSLQLQNQGIDATFYGGWLPNARTRVNDRVLSAWFLLQLRSAQARGMMVPETSVARAVAFIGASQKQKGVKADEIGGFSVDAEGLTVPRATSAGAAVLTLLGDDTQRALLAGEWLSRHSPQWYGPNFFETSFFAVRALYHQRHLDNGAAFKRYFGRLQQLLAERQEADGSMPFPPGHGGPLLAMGPAYATAMTMLILNVDRGILPMDLD